MLLPALFILLFLTLVILGCVVLITFQQHDKANQHLQQLLIENNTLKQVKESEVNKALEKAHFQTEKIIAEANQKAEDIIQDATTFRSLNDKDLVESLKELVNINKKAFDEISSSLEAEYKASVQEVSSKSIEIFKNATKDIEKITSEEIKDFRSLLEKETIQSQKIVGDKIESEYKEVASEIDAYKKQQLLQAEKTIKDSLHEIIYTVLADSLTSEQKEQLLNHALIEATQKLTPQHPTTHSTDVHKP